MSNPSPASSRGLWFLVAFSLLVALTAYTRGVAPWRLEVTNDEMKHLESWRNRYRTDDIYPLFLERLELDGWLQGDQLELLRTVYESGPLVQRGFLVISDGHPPLFSVLSEVIEAVTRSNLVAARAPSAIASMLAVFVMFLLGRRLRDDTLGLWLAALVAIGFLAQVYAGIARSYSFAQFTTILALLVFVREQQEPNRSPWRLWLAAFVAQATHWLAWPLVAPLVLIELVRRLRGGAGIGRLVRQTWWYALLSVGLLGLAVLHMANPAIPEVAAGASRTMRIWFHFSLGSPFAVVDELMALPPFTLLSPGLISLLLLSLLGTCAVLGDDEYREAAPKSGLTLLSVRIGLMAFLVACLVVPIVLYTGPRFALIYITGPVIMAGIGAQWVLRVPRASQVVLVILLIASAVQRIGWPQDPYRFIFWKDTEYEAVAAQVREALGPDDIWCAYPYFRGDCLYPYGPLPEPVQPLDRKQFETFLEDVPRTDGAVVVVATREVIDQYPVLYRAPERWQFRNNYFVVRIPPRRRRW